MLYVDVVIDHLLLLCVVCVVCVSCVVCVVCCVVLCANQQQLLPYNFYPIHQIWEYIKRFPSMEEAELYSTSLKIEPRKADRSEIL